MSQENIDLHRRAVEAYNTHDAEALIALCDPSIEAHSVFAAVGGAVYHGHDGLRRFFRDARDSWGDEIRIEPEAYFDLGESTLAFLMLHGQGRQSGARGRDADRPGGEVARRPLRLLQVVRRQRGRAERVG